MDVIIYDYCDILTYNQDYLYYVFLACYMKKKKCLLRNRWPLC